MNRSQAGEIGTEKSRNPPPRPGLVDAVGTVRGGGGGSAPPGEAGWERQRWFVRRTLRLRECQGGARQPTSRGPKRHVRVGERERVCTHREGVGVAGMKSPYRCR